MARLPSLLAALKETKADGSPRDPKERGLALVAVARAWFDNQRWVVREQIKCREMVNGKQWGYFDDKLWSWIPDPEAEDDDEVRLVVNLIKPATDQMIAMLTRDPPQFGATGGQNEIADTAASQFATELIRFDWRSDRLDEMFRLSAKNVAEVGESWLLTQWDPQGGPWGKVGEEFSLVETPPPVPGMPPSTDFKIEDKLGLQGTPKTRLIPGENVAVDPHARSSDADGLAIFVRERVSRAEMRERFPDKWEKVATGEDGSEGTQDQDDADRADRTSVLGDAPTWGRGDDPKKESVDLYSCWIRATSDYPRGRMVCVASDGTICHEGHNEVYQLEDEEPDLAPRVPWPLSRAICDPHDSSPRGRSRVLDAMEPQQAYNELISKEMEHYATIANTKVTLPAGLNVEWTDKIGQVIRVPRNLPLQSGAIGYLQPPVPPDYLTPAREFEAKVEKILGVNQSTQGQVPYSNTSGRAINAAAEKDETRIAPVKRALMATWAEVMLFRLRLYRRYATYERQMLMVGENHATEFEFWDRSKLSKTLDVVVYNDAMLPSDPTAKGLAINQIAMTLGQIQDEKFRVQVARMYGLRNFESVLSEMNRHDEKAERENRKIMSGEPVEVWEADDHLVHKARIEDLINSEQFERQVAEERANPEFQTVDPMTGQPVPDSPTFNAAMAHWQQHAEYLQPPGAAPGVPGAPPMVPPGGGGQSGPIAPPEPVAGEASRAEEVARNTTEPSMSGAA